MNILKLFKKTLGLFTLTVLSSIALSSCSKESIEEAPLNSSLNESTIEQKIDLDNWGDGDGSGNGNIFVALVEGDSCGLATTFDDNSGNGSSTGETSVKYTYTVYASASQAKPYDREIQAAVIKSGGIIEAKLLIIPANQYISSNVPAFVGATTDYNNVQSKAYNVLVNGTIENDYSFPSIAYDLDNCFTSSSGSNCSTGIYQADDPDTVANESPGDQDHDGICNITDTDDNGNNIPDEWED